MEPHIQYVRAKDGVSIAFWTLGEGKPFVHVPSIPFSHVQLEWQVPECRRWYERLARKRRLVRYDGRGTGLSDREVTDFSLDAQIGDLQAVVDCLSLDDFALYATGDSGMTAVAYAARYPRKVTHLILWCTWARRADVSRMPRTQALRALLDVDWEIYTETVARVLLGWDARGQAAAFAAFLRECTTREVLLSAAGTIYGLDVTDLLPEVRCPTLVLHRRGIPSPDINVVKGLVSRIPGARLALLEGSSPLPFQGGVESVLKAILEFIGEEYEAGAETQPPAVSGAPVTVLFTDMEGSSALGQRLGDAAAQEVRRAHNRIVRGALSAHGGNEIKHTGDGIMASFASASRALECAVAIQRAIAEWNAEADARDPRPGARVPIHVRIGLNAGEPIAEEKDLFGTAVDLAKRICDRAAPGQILIPEGVRHLLAGKGFLVADQGLVSLKGFEEPVRLYEVRWHQI